jgi:hypothetical protein
MADTITPNASSNETPAASPVPKINSPFIKEFFDFSRWFQWQTLLYFGVAATTLAAIWKLLGQKDESLHRSDWRFWVAVVVTALPLILAFFFHVLPALVKKRQTQAEEDESVGPAKGGPLYFRLDPYGDIDRAEFNRVDQAHRTALAKFRNCRLPYFYVVGVSGSGKSSVLSAFLIPELQSDALVVTLRGAGDPLTRLREALLVGVWSDGTARKHENDSLPELVKNAAEHLKRNGKELVLVYDQFEELLTSEPTPDSSSVLGLLREVAAGNFQNCRVILSFRIDYFEWLTRATFPALGEVNHFTVEPFDADPARQFLEGGFERMGRTLLNRVITEAAVLDDVTPRMRPITLNMVGLMLRGLPSGSRLTIGHRPFADHIRRMLQEGDVRDLGPTVLRQLLVDQNKRVRRTVNQIARSVSGDVHRVNACVGCLAAAGRGLVRCLNPNETDIGNREWEVSHDFVAALLGNVLPTLLPGPRPSLFRLLRPWLTLASILLWLVTFLVVLPYVQRRETDATVGRLHTEFGITIKYADNSTAITVRLDPRKGLTSLHGAIPLLKKLKNITYFDATKCGRLVDVDGLDELTTLQTINLSECHGLTSVELKALDALQSLNLTKCMSLTELNLKGLGNLQTLQLWDCFSLPRFDGNGLTALNTLNLGGCNKLASVNVKGLTALKSLNLLGCESLPSVDAKELTALQTLNLTQCYKLTTVELKGLTTLNTLYLGSCIDLTSVELTGLTSLQHLDLSFCWKLPTVNVEGLANLKYLDLDHCLGLTSVDVRGLPALQTLFLRECTNLISVDVTGLAALQTIDVSQCPNLKSVVGKDGLPNLTIRK